MKALYINGSNRKENCSKILNDLKSKNDKLIELSDKSINYCLGCNACIHELKEYCVIEDDMQEIYKDLQNAELIVFVSPIYYYNFSAQLKKVIDRFYAIDEELHTKKEVILLATAYNDEEKVIKPIQIELEAICEYFGWNIKGEVFALGCGEPEDITKTKYLEDAYNLGKNI